MEVLIDRTLGTHFGTLDAGSPFTGVPSMFDGDTLANNPDFGAYKLGLSAYVGTAFPTGKVFSRALYYGWNDRGILDAGTSGTVAVYGKNGTPASGTDGTVLGSVNFTEPSPLVHGHPLTIMSNGNTNAFTHIWALITTASATGICGAELVLYEKTEADAKPCAIFIGAGQSNMVGRAPLPSQSVYSNSDRVKNFALDGQIKPAVDPLQDPTGSASWTQFNSVPALCGPMLSFANCIAPEFEASVDILIVNSSKGSTSIDLWQPGGSLYDGMIERAQAALAAAPAGSFIAGFVWQQGESDTATEAAAANWMLKIQQLVANMRSDLELPNLPVVLIGLNGYDAFAPAWKQLRFAQYYMQLPTNCAFVKVSDLSNGSSPDWGDTTSVLSIGARAATAMQNML